MSALHCVSARGFWAMLCVFLSMAGCVLPAGGLRACGVPVILRMAWVLGPHFGFDGGRNNGQSPQEGPMPSPMGLLKFQMKENQAHLPPPA